MTKEALNHAVSEAERFLASVKAYKAREVKEREYRERMNEKYPGHGYSPDYASATGTKEAGSLRRASLDLSRALTELRKP